MHFVTKTLVFGRIKVLLINTPLIITVWSPFFKTLLEEKKRGR